VTKDPESSSSQSRWSLVRTRFWVLCFTNLFYSKMYLNPAVDHGPTIVVVFNRNRGHDDADALANENVLLVEKVVAVWKNNTGVHRRDRVSQIIEPVVVRVPPSGICGCIQSKVVCPLLELVRLSGDLGELLGLSALLDLASNVRVRNANGSGVDHFLLEKN
jgi:hypothetical protein